MKTKAQIEFDFAQARMRAAEIDEVAADLARISKQDMENTMAELAGAWKGDSARLFQNKADALQGKVSATSRELGAIADTIREIARIMYEAEMEALRLATQRD